MDHIKLCTINKTDKNQKKNCKKLNKFSKQINEIGKRNAIDDGIVV